MLTPAPAPDSVGRRPVAAIGDDPEFVIGDATADAGPDVAGAALAGAFTPVHAHNAGGAILGDNSDDDEPPSGGPARRAPIRAPPIFDAAVGAIITATDPEVGAAICTAYCMALSLSVLTRY